MMERLPFNQLGSLQDTKDEIEGDGSMNRDGFYPNVATMGLTKGPRKIKM